jgi:hypothetical protein
MTMKITAGGKDTVGDMHRVVQSIPASYTVWKDGTQAIAESNMEGGTDYTTGTDAVVIQNAVDASPATGGKIVLNAPTFDLYNWIDVKNLNNCIIDGLGVTTLKLQSDAIAAFNNSTNAVTSNVTIQNLTIDGNSKNSFCICLNNNCTHYRLSHLYIKNGGSHLIYSGPSYYLTIDNCVFDHNALLVGADMVAVGGEDLLIYGNTFIRSAGSLGGACLTSGGMKRARILGNNFKISALCYASISLESAYDVFNDVVISDNTVSAVAGDITKYGGMSIGNSLLHLFENAVVTNNIIYGGSITANNVKDLTIKNNQMRNSVYGLLGSTISHAIISGNLIENTSLPAPAADEGGIYLSICDDVVVTDNIVVDTQVTPTTPYGIWLGAGATYNLLRGNKIYNCGWCYGPANGWGILVATTCLRNVVADNIIRYCNGWGIQIDTGAVENFVHGNFACDNTTGALGDSGTDTYKRDNYDESGLVAET